MFKKIKQRKRNILLNSVCEICCSLIHYQINGTVAKNSHPQ
ncbi:Uncharacterised protein [Klebsiella pneumoniae]|nr:Uncharacterised protein [Klebsiella pneumoniae]